MVRKRIYYKVLFWLTKALFLKILWQIFYVNQVKNYIIFTRIAVLK